MLSISDFIFCENRNHSNKLLSKLGIKKKLIPLHDHNEKDIKGKELEIGKKELGIV